MHSCCAVDVRALSAGRGLKCIDACLHLQHSLRFSCLHSPRHYRAATGVLILEHVEDVKLWS